MYNGHMKTCSSCSVEKNLSEFHKQSKSKDGHQTRCKECNKEQRKAYYKTAHGKAKNDASGKRLAVRNQFKLIEYLKEHPCIACGETDIVVLQFDHRDPSTKIAGVCDMARKYSWDKVEAEIAKCDVLCANDHTRRTAQQFGWLKLLT